MMYYLIKKLTTYEKQSRNNYKTLLNIWKTFMIGH